MVWWDKLSIGVVIPKPTLLLFKNEKNYVFGGYSSISWAGGNVYLTVKGCFIFTLVNPYNIPPTKFVNKENKTSVGHLGDYGPIFGNDGDIYVYSGNFGESKRSQSNFPFYYEDTTNKGFSLFIGDSNDIHMTLTELEVKKVTKE